MTNRLWVLRHGESTANVQGLIVSVPGPRALTEVGLTARGRGQARAAGREGLAQGLGPRTVVVSSDFARALETAEQFAAELGAAPPRADRRLRERSFGWHDEGPASAYAQIWQVDRERGTHDGGVEQVAAVATRVTAALQEADTLAREAPVVLVAHGDVLQIALAVGAGRDPHDHREVPHLGNAELRRIGAGRGAAGGTDGP
ncbi:MAG: phosphoglycerate mutase family protein [Brachybacterium sp.]|nr:phosphoglycerate mutase family protein [Brachybacterium sp.]